MYIPSAPIITHTSAVPSAVAHCVRIGAILPDERAAASKADVWAMGGVLDAMVAGGPIWPADMQPMEAGFDEGLLSLCRPISLLYGESL